MFRLIRRLVRILFKLGLLFGLGYAVYRLINEEPAPRPGEPPVPPGPPAPGAPTPRPEPVRSPPRAGTAPVDTRPATRPVQRTPGARPAPASGNSGSVRSIGVGEVPQTVLKWVEPTAGGACPPSHPVKAKLDSGIFHMPGGRHYDRVTPDRCYRDAASAESDGLRQSKQ